MRVSTYYERYWTVEGFMPTRTGPRPELAALYREHVQSTDSCLDFGCGDGGTSGFILNELGGSYLGVDVSTNAVSLARQRGLDAQVIQDSSRLPYADATFGVVVCIEVLEHLFEPLAAATEASRVLQNHGRLIATVPNAMHFRNRLDMLIGAWQPGGDLLGREEPWRSPHVRFFSLASFKRMLQTAGFTVVTVGGFPNPIGARIPGIRSKGAGAISRRACRLFPGVFSGQLWAVARKDSA